MKKLPGHQVTRSPEKAEIKNLVSVFLTCAFCLLTCDLFAQTISSEELINNARQYNGKSVLYRGEVIGEVMLRGEYAWINVHDGKYAIGVWTPKNLTKDILFTGSYKFKGDEVEITGIFHRSCQEHGGDLDIHAQGLRKVNVGYRVPENFNPIKIRIILILLGVLGVTWILSLLKKR